jgi:chromosome condensin MukBEF ATPase and DNA-binding subunit MukB
MNLANELASFESELESLRSENKILREAKILADFELDQLRRRINHVEARAEAHMASRVRLKTLLDQTGQSLVAAMNRYNAETKESLGHDAQDITPLIETTTKEPVA